MADEESRVAKWLFDKDEEKGLIEDFIYDPSKISLLIKGSGGSGKLLKNNIFF